MKFRVALIFSALLLVSTAIGQTKLEREHRIKKSQFPKNSILFMDSKIGPVKKLRFYREIDSSAIYYTSKFKKDRLHYGVQFTENGQFQAVTIAVEEIDIPQDSWEHITYFLKEQFTKHRIRKILQQYSASEDKPEAITLKNAFQNLIIPKITYEVLIKGKIERECDEYKIVFDADGNVKQIKKAIPANYDHILY